MKPAKVDFSIVRGDSKANTFSFEDVNESPLDLSQVQDVVAEVYSGSGDRDYLMKAYSISSGDIEVIEPNRIVFTFTQGFTKRLNEGNYYWALRMIYEGNVRHTWANGNIVIK